MRRVNELAFGRPAEADVVDRLRAACADAQSLAALEDEMVVGHILFTPAIIEDAGRRVTGTGLAPLAVRPDHQGCGVGSALVRQGLAVLREQGCPFVNFGTRRRWRAFPAWPGTGLNLTRPSR